MPSVVALVSKWKPPEGLTKTKAVAALKETLVAAKHKALKKSAGGDLAVHDRDTGRSWAIYLYPGTEAKLRAALRKVLEGAAFDTNHAGLLLAGGPDVLPPDLAFFFSDAPAAALEARLLGNRPNAIETGELSPDADFDEREDWDHHQTRRSDTTGDSIFALGARLHEFEQTLGDLAFVIRDALLVTLDPAAGTKTLEAIDTLVLAARPKGLSPETSLELADALPPLHLLTALTLFALETVRILKPRSEIVPAVDRGEVAPESAASTFAVNVHGTTVPVGSLVLERWRRGRDVSLAQAWTALAPTLPPKPKWVASPVQQPPPNATPAAPAAPIAAPPPPPPPAPTTEAEAITLLAEWGHEAIALEALSTLNPARFEQEATALLDRDLRSERGPTTRDVEKILRTIGAHAPGALLDRLVRAAGSNGLDRLEASLLGRTGDLRGKIPPDERPRLAEVLDAILRIPKEKGAYPYAGELLAEAVRLRVPGALEYLDSVLHGDYAGFLGWSHLLALGEALGAEAEGRLRYLLGRNLQVTAVLEALSRHCPENFPAILEEQLALADSGKLSSGTASAIRETAKRLGGSRALPALVDAAIASYDFDKFVGELTGVSDYGPSHPDQVEASRAARLQEVYALVRDRPDPLRRFVEVLSRRGIVGILLKPGTIPWRQVVIDLGGGALGSQVVAALLDVPAGGTIDPARVTPDQWQRLQELFEFTQSPNAPENLRSNDLIRALATTGLLPKIRHAKEWILARFQAGEHWPELVLGLASFADPVLDELILSTEGRIGGREAVFARVGDDALWQRFGDARPDEEPSAALEALLEWTRDPRWIPYALEGLALKDEERHYTFTQLLRRTITPATVGPVLSLLRQGKTSLYEFGPLLRELGGPEVMAFLLEQIDQGSDEYAVGIADYLPEPPPPAVLEELEWLAKRSRDEDLGKKAIKRIAELRAQAA